MTSPSTSLQSAADAARIKRLERELAETKSRFGRELEREMADNKSKLDEIERKDVEIQGLITIKDRALKDLDLAHRNSNQPKGSFNEKDGEELKRLRAEVAQQQDALSRYREGDERFAKVTRELKEQNRVFQERDQKYRSINEQKQSLLERIQVLQERNQVLEEEDQRYRKLEERHRELEGNCSDLWTSISRYMNVVEKREGQIRQLVDDKRCSSKDLLNNVRDKYARISANSASNTSQTPRNVSWINPPVSGVVEKQGNTNELAEMEEAEWKASIEYEDSQILCSEPASGEAQALSKRVPRSSAETELLRLKDRKSLNRPGPF